MYSQKHNLPMSAGATTIGTTEESKSSHSNIIARMDSLEKNQTKISVEIQCRRRAEQLFEGLSNHCELKAHGFKFIFAKDDPGMKNLLDLVWGYQIICTPPDVGYITNYPFTCQVVRTAGEQPDGNGITVEISLQGIDVETFEGFPVYMGTEYMGYRSKNFKTNKEVIEQFEKILASKSESKIVEAEIHKEAKCCVFGLCTLYSRTGYCMSDFIKAHSGDKDKIVKAIKEVLEKSK